MKGTSVTWGSSPNPNSAGCPNTAKKASGVYHSAMFISALVNKHMLIGGKDTKLDTFPKLTSIFQTPSLMLYEKAAQPCARQYLTFYVTHLVRSTSSNCCRLSTAFTTSPNHQACIRGSSVSSGWKLHPNTLPCRTAIMSSAPG